MSIKVIIIAVVILAVIVKMFFKKKPNEQEVFREILDRSFKTGGILTTKDVKKFKDNEMTKQLLKKMLKDGVLTINVVDKANMEYMFPELPLKFKPEFIEDLEAFNTKLSDMGYNSEDGQIFLSEIIFAFDMDYTDIIEAFEMYSKNSWVTKNISKSGNVYLMFDKAKM